MQYRYDFDIKEPNVKEVHAVVDFCASNPCQNGTCYNDMSGFMCACPFGYRYAYWVSDRAHLCELDPDLINYNDSNEFLPCSFGMTGSDCQTGQ